jgi:hypothetical protein
MTIKGIIKEISEVDSKVFNTDREKRKEKKRLKKQLRKLERKKLNDEIKNVS